MNDASSESSDGSASSDGSSSEGEDEVQEPPPEVEVKVEPENSVKWNLSEFLPGGIQKSPNEAPLSHEPVETVKMEEQGDEEDGEIQRTPSDHYQNENSNSSIPDNKSDVSQEADELSMPPPAKVKSPSKTPDKTPDINTVLVYIKNLQKIRPISSISDSDDNVDNVTSGNERPKKPKKRPKKRPRPEVDGGNNSSSDESSRFSESRRRSSMDEKKPVRGRPKNNSLSLQPPPIAMPPYDVTNTSSDTNSTNGTKKTHKSPRKEPKSRKATTSRRRQSISHKKSRETIPSSDGSSDENQSKVQIQKPPKPSPVKSKEPSNHQKAVKKPSKKKQKPPEKIESPIASSSDSEQEHRQKHSHYQSPVPPMSSSSNEHSDSDRSSRSGHGAKNKKIEKNVSDKNKNDTLRRLFNMTKVGEGGKGGKGGAKGKGQVVVITPDDAQNQSKSNDSNASSNGAISVQNPKYLSPSSAFNITAPLSLIVRIDLSRIDLSRLQIPAEKLKNTVIRTKSPAVPIEQQQPQPQPKLKKRRRSSVQDEQDRWRHHPNSNNNSSKNFDQLSVSSSSSSSSAASSEHQMENPAARMTAYTTNYTNDQLNNNVDHKTKDMNSFYHSPSSVDTKLPKIKRETNAYMKQFTVSSSNLSKDPKMPSNDFKNKIKQEVKEEFDGAQEIRKRASSMTNSSHTYKDKKRKRPDGASDNSLPLPPTNHERLPKSGLVNGDSMPSSLEVVKKVYVSYFERTSDEIEKAEAR